MIPLTVFVLLTAVFGILAWRFREEIRAFSVSRQYSTKELEDQLAGNDQTIRDAVEASSDVTVRAPTDEEREALRDGSLTQEELIERLTGSNAATEPKPPAEQTGTAADPAKPDSAKPDSAKPDSAKPTGNQPVPDKPEKPAETKPEPTGEQRTIRKSSPRWSRKSTSCVRSMSGHSRIWRPPPRRTTTRCRNPSARARSSPRW